VKRKAEAGKKRRRMIKFGGKKIYDSQAYEN